MRVYMKAIIDSFLSIFGTNLLIDFNSMMPRLASCFSGSLGSPYVSP